MNLQKIPWRMIGNLSGNFGHLLVDQAIHLFIEQFFFDLQLWYLIHVSVHRSFLYLFIFDIQLGFLIHVSVDWVIYLSICGAIMYIHVGTHTHTHTHTYIYKCVYVWQYVDVFCLGLCVLWVFFSIFEAATDCLEGLLCLSILARRPHKELGRVNLRDKK